MITAFNHGLNGASKSSLVVPNTGWGIDPRSGEISGLHPDAARGWQDFMNSPYLGYIGGI